MWRLHRTLTPVCAGVSLYLPHTTNPIAPPYSNMYANIVGELLHKRSYAALGRLDNRGWVQIAELPKISSRVIHGRRRRRHSLVGWVYAVSYYPSVARARAVVADAYPWGYPGIKRLPVPQDLAGDDARLYRTLIHGVLGLCAAFGRGPVVVELVGGTSSGPPFNALARRYFVRQRIALAHILDRVLLAGATPTPTASPVATAPS